MLPRPPTPTLFPYTTLFRSPTSATDGTAVLGQIVHGQPPLAATIDLKSTRLNSSQQIISYAVCCVKLLVPVVVGVPEICPPEDSVNPAGSAPEISDQL